MRSEFFDSLKGQVLDDDLIQKIQAESGKDVTAAKTKMQTQIDALNNQVSDLQGQVTQRDTDLNDLKEQLTQAGQSAAKLSEVQANFESLSKKYNQEMADYKAQLEKQQYEFLAKETMSGIEFSSNAAKENFYTKLLQKNLPVENQKLLGFAEYLEAMKQDDPGAFVKKDENNQHPSFSNPSNSNSQEPTKNTFGFNFVGVRKHD